MIEEYFEAVNGSNVPAAAIEPWRADAVNINSTGMISGKAQIIDRTADTIKRGITFEHRKPQAHGLGCMF